MKFITLTLFGCAALLTGCMSYSSTLHTSIYHGTDDHAGLSDFYYLQYAVSGSASASYDFRGGGFVRVVQGFERQRRREDGEYVGGGWIENTRTLLD